MGDADTAFDARCLWRAARAGTLATQAGGQPFAALVTPAVAPDGDALLLLSGLSVHTRQLRAEPRCALLVSGAAQSANPQTAPRLTVTGRAVQEPAPWARRYWLDRHPYAAFYADLPDFTLWRVIPEAGHFVAGFARAGRLTRDELVPSAEAAQAIAAAADRILGHCNADHADTLALLAGIGPGEPARMIGVDADGFDVAAGDAIHRVPFDRPVADAFGVRAAMVRMVGERTGPDLGSAAGQPGLGSAAGQPGLGRAAGQPGLDRAAGQSGLGGADG